LVSADFGAESFAITWIPGRDNALVDDDSESSQFAPAFATSALMDLKGGRSYYDPFAKGCDEQSGRVTNGRDNLLRVEDVPDNFSAFGS
jgi:hypothetical protein